MVVVPLILVALLGTFLFSPFVVEGDSMLPGLKSGDVFLVDRMMYLKEDPQRNDIVVFYLDEDPSYFYVKRIIGLPFEELRLEKDGVDRMDLWPNSPHRFAEPFVTPNPHPSERFLSDANELGQQFKVPKDSYFVLGDNREHSQDSRFFQEPFIPRKNIVGQFTFTIGNVVDGTLNSELFHPVKKADQVQELPMQPMSITTTKTYGEVGLIAQVADSEEERRIGLMFRKKMAKDEGMFFIFDDEKPRSFWMKNTLIPLDIIFLDKGRQVISIQKNVQPCKVDPCPLYSSVGSAKYVLELNGGESDKIGVAEGSQLMF